jgi:hypothetical protein
MGSRIFVTILLSINSELFFAFHLFVLAISSIMSIMSNITNALAIIPITLGVINIWIVRGSFDYLHHLRAPLSIGLALGMLGLILSFRKNPSKKVLLSMIILENLCYLIATNTGLSLIGFWFLIGGLLFSFFVVVSGLIALTNEVGGKYSGKKIAEFFLFISYIFVPLTYIVMIAARSNPDSIFALSITTTIAVGASFIACMYFLFTATPFEDSHDEIHAAKTTMQGTPEVNFV